MTNLALPEAVADPSSFLTPSLEQGYRLVFERNPTPLWLIDFVTHRFLAVNAAAITEYGYPPESFLAMTIRDVCDEADLARFDGMAGGADDRFTGVWVHRRNDRTPLHVEIR